MTSREALEKLCNNCNNKMGENYTHCLHRRVCGTHCEEYKEIEKNLEMLKIIKDNFIAYKDLYHEGKWQLTLKQKNAFVEGSKEYELLKEWLKNE